MNRRALLKTSLGLLGAGYSVASQAPEATHRPRGVGALKITDAKAIRRNKYLYYQIFTDGGVTGVGEPSPSNELAGEFLEKILKPMIVGMDAFGIEKIWEKMYVGTYKERGQSASIAISGVDIALHDIVGKALGVPVYQLLGGLYRGKIPMYASYTSRERSPVDQAKLCAKMVEQGFTGTKIKIAARQGADGPPAFPDEDRVREARAAIGPKIKLMVDANSGYSVPHAIRMGRFLESQDVFWFEEPVPFWDYAATAEVARALDIPIAGGEQDHTRWDFQKIITAKALDILQADVTKAGGLSECKKIAALIDAAGLYYVPHDTSGEIGLVACMHLVAATPICRYLHEYIVEERKNPSVLKEPLIPRNGEIEVPQKPGLGIELAG
jgi:D-galactarolactone cycloisomerase